MALLDRDSKGRFCKKEIKHTYFMICWGNHCERKPSVCFFPGCLSWYIYVAHSFLGRGKHWACLDAFPLRSAHTPPLGQEELEFAIMRIEALKLARQIALASRHRQDAKVLVCHRSSLPPGNAVCASVVQGCFANHRPGRRCGCLTNWKYNSCINTCIWVLLNSGMRELLDGSAG